MELKLIVSGAPSGENIWGAQADSAFIGSLYIPSKENQKFDIRLNKSGNTIYAYYHYLVYNNLNDFGGRTGSYFCLTVRLDCFCMDYKSIYNTLDTVFRKRIVGSIVVQEQGNRLQFRVPSFEKAETELLDIEKYIRNSLGACLSASDFKRIPSVPSCDGVVRFNLEEATTKDVMQAVGQYGSCSISSEYVSMFVQQQLKEEYRQGALSRQSEINKLQEQITVLETELSHIKEKELRQKKTIVNNVQQNAYAGQPEWIGRDTRYEKNQGINHSYHPHEDDEYESSSSHITIYVIVALVVFLLAIISLLHLSNNLDNDEHVSSNTEQIDSTKNDTLKEPVDANKTSIEQMQGVEISKEESSND